MRSLHLQLRSLGKHHYSIFTSSRVVYFLPIMIGVLLATGLQFSGESSASTFDSINFIPALAFVLGFIVWYSSEQQQAKLGDKVFACCMAVLFVIPSYQISWAIMLSMCLWLFIKTANNTRAKTGLLIMAAAAAQPMLVTYLLKWFAGPVLSLDAALVAFLLQLITGSGSHVGNIVYGPSDHQLLILRGCSSLSNIGSTWLAWYALSRFNEVRLSYRDGLVIIVLTAAILALNLLRLVSMAIDISWHQWWHSPEGEQWYQLISSLFLLSAVILGIRYASQNRNQE